VNDDRAEWLAAAAEAHREAVFRERVAAGHLAAMMSAARDSGMSLRVISKHVGLSHQRVAQIIGKKGGA
jgi:lambda repressor-like predicted transcriptional regulator